MKRNYKVVIPFILVVYLVISLFILSTNLFCSENMASTLADRGLKIIEAESHIRNVFVLKGSEWQNLTKFSRPRHIYAYEASLDGKYAFVWHEDYPPRALSIYDLQEMKLVKNIFLGFGGYVKWNQEDNILHVYGCGSGCMVAKMLNREGQTLLEIAGSPVNISPSGRYLLLYTIGWVGQQNIELYDLFRKDLISHKKPLLVINGVGNLDSIIWNDEHKITMTYADAFFENDRYIKREVSIDLSKY